MTLDNKLGKVVTGGNVENAYVVPLGYLVTSTLAETKADVLESSDLGKLVAARLRSNGVA